MTQKAFPELEGSLARQLAKIEPTNGYYYPAKVILRDGTHVDRVYLADADRWYVEWGIWPQDDPGKRYLPLHTVREIQESPTRLPARFADELYAAGESGMGFCVFTVVFQDGARVPFVTGNAVDFISFPPGQSPATVASVIPHVGKNDPGLTSGPGYSWCLFSRSI